jgi:putative ABC transport system permease protein
MGQEEAGRFSYAYDMTYTFTGDAAANKSGVESLESLEKKSGVTGKDRIVYTYGSVDEKRTGNVFAKSGDAGGNGNGCTVRLITQDVYNDLVDEQMNKAKDESLGIGTEKLSLGKDEIAVYATDEDFDGSSLSFDGKELKVVRILEDLPLARHNKARIGTSFYYFVVSDEDMIREITDDNIYTSYSMNFADSDKDIRAKFANEAFTVSQSLPNYFRLDSYDIGNADNVAMNGGLLFIGIFFSIIFAACLVMIMYYRQLSEGLEDREKFDILRKVGFDSRDAKKTIKDQMKIVFVMPAAMAVFHVIGCLNLPRTLFYTLNFYNVSYIIKASCIVIVIYIAFYFLCYQLTEKEYYNIVMSK